MGLPGVKQAQACTACPRAQHAQQTILPDTVDVPTPAHPQSALVSNLYFISQLLFRRYGGNFLVQLLGRWQVGCSFLSRPAGWLWAGGTSCRAGSGAACQYVNTMAPSLPPG